MNTPKYSVVVPVHNIDERYLEKCVDSILGQTLHDLELILVDDGSTDGSGTLCDNYASRDTRVRVFHKKKKKRRRLLRKKFGDSGSARRTHHIFRCR